MTPSAASCTATTNSIEPSTTDWTWPAPSPWTKRMKKRPQTTARDQRHERGRDQEHPQRLVLRVDAEDRQRVRAHVRRDRPEQARLAHLRVGPDRDVVDRDQHLAGLDDRLERVGEARHDLHLERGLAVVGAKARGRVGHRRLRRAPHDPAAEPLEELLQRGEVLDRLHLAVADDEVGVAAQDRRHQLRDVGRVVLVVGVGVDDHVGAQLQRRVEPCLERRSRGPCCSSAARRGRRRGRARPRPCASVEPSSMTSHSTSSKPSTSRGRSGSVTGSDSSSLRQGIWMISFMRGDRLNCRRPHYPARPGDRRGRPCGSAPARLRDLRPSWKAQPSNEQRPALRALPGARCAARRRRLPSGRSSA